VVVNVFRDASDSIATHFRFRSVGVEHAHLRVCLVGRTDENQTVTADAFMAVRYLSREESRILREGFIKAIDINVVIAGAVHLGEIHGFVVTRYEKRRALIRTGRRRTPSAG
jgi:tryptophan synthase beta subunit